jgi:hypothetical protein
VLVLLVDYLFMQLVVYLQVVLISHFEGKGLY